MNAFASATLPRILLLEDDPVSAAFLRTALEALPAQVDVAGTLAEARVLAEAHAHDLWLFDVNLPDGRGVDLLVALRERGIAVPALAHTADARRHELDALINAGFEEVLLKPLSVAQLQGAVGRFCARSASIETSIEPSIQTNDARPDEPMRGGKLPVWDDDAALRALNGHRPHVDAMRGLFAQELPQVAMRVAAALAERDTAALRHELHKLQASCGFVGAARLGDAVAGLRDAPESAAAAARFEGALQDTLSSPSA